MRATVGGAQAEVLFCSLTPGFAGLYTVVLKVPEGVPPGWAEVVVAVDGVAGPEVQLEVQ